MFDCPWGYPDFQENLIADQTLEPTQVAGFNQFFADIDATDAWVYGAAVDQKFSQNIYAGANSPAETLNYYSGSTPCSEADGKIWAAPALTGLQWLAFRAEYEYEKFSIPMRLI
jgi:hypothetical protein